MTMAQSLITILQSAKSPYSEGQEYLQKRVLETFRVLGLTQDCAYLLNPLRFVASCPM